MCETNAPYVEEQKLFESEWWFISRSLLVLSLLILVKEPPGKCPLGKANSRRKNKIWFWEDVKGNSSENLSASTKFVTRFQFENICEVLDKEGDKPSGTINR
jgi:hypothetical protein